MNYHSEAVHLYDTVSCLPVEMINIIDEYGGMRQGYDCTNIDHGYKIYRGKIDGWIGGPTGYQRVSLGYANAMIKQTYGKSPAHVAFPTIRIITILVGLVAGLLLGANWYYTIPYLLMRHLSRNLSNPDVTLLQIIAADMTGLMPFGIIRTLVVCYTWFGLIDKRILTTQRGFTRFGYTCTYFGMMFLYIMFPVLQVVDCAITTGVLWHYKVL